MLSPALSCTTRQKSHYRGQEPSKRYPPGVSFLAYATPRWGVNVAAADLDGDGVDEILTGAGPGAVFGPHVRGWKVEADGSAPLPGPPNGSPPAPGALCVSPRGAEGPDEWNSRTPPEANSAGVPAGKRNPAAGRSP